MFILIRQELYKLFMRKKTYVVLIGFILLTVFLAYGIKQNADSMKKYNTPEFQIENLQNNIEYLEQEKNNVPKEYKGSEEKIKSYQEDLNHQITSLQAEINSLKMRISSGKSDWRAALSLRIKDQETMIAENKANVPTGDLAQWNLELERLKYLQEQEINPEIEYDFGGYMFINELIAQLGQVFLVIGIAVFAADMVSGEWTPPTLKLLLTQPVSRSKVLLSKFIAIVTASIGLILIVELIAFLMVGLLYGFGNSSYPSFVGMKYQFDPAIFLDNGGHPLFLIDGSAKIIPISQFTTKLVLTQGLFILATTSFVFMISTLVKNSMVSMGTSVVSLVAATIIFQLSALQKIGVYFFTSYSAIESMVTGSMALNYNNPNVSGQQGVVVFLAWTVVCGLISHYSFVKRDLLL